MGSVQCFLISINVFVIESSRVTQYVIQVHTYSSIIIHFKTTDYIYTFFKVKKGECFLREKCKTGEAKQAKTKQHLSHRPKLFLSLIQMHILWNCIVLWSNEQNFI